MVQRAAHLALIAVGIFTALNILVLGTLYLLYPGYVDTGEPNIVALGCVCWDGHPVYLPIDDAARITNLYGPYLYLIHAAVFSVLGASVATGKAAGITALVFTIAVSGVAQASRSRAAAAFAIACTAAVVVVTLPASIWDRPETFLMLSVALGVWINNARGRGTAWLRVAGFGVLIGVAMGLKVFAAIYFLPFGLLMLFRDGIKACIATVVVAFCVAALPFLTPAFELQYLLDLVGLMADKPNSMEGLIKVLRYAGFYVLPALLFVGWAWRTMPGDERRDTAILMAGFVLALAAVLYPAQKPGAGMHYLLPFAAVAFDLAARGLHQLSAKASATVTAVIVCVVLNVIALPAEKRFLRNLHWDEAAAVSAEIQRIAADNPGKSIEIGIGDSNESYRRTYQRTRLVFDGHPYSLDTSILIDTTAWGIDITPATLALIDNCTTDIWLIPAGELPFAWIGYYGKDVYGQPFRDSFNTAFGKTESREYFDIYRCRKRS